MTFTGGPSFLEGAGQCTANFVFTDASGNVYLGQAAHCSSTGGDTETNGCSTKSLPLGTPIYAGDLVNGGVQTGTKIGTLAYNSWIAMQQKPRDRTRHVRIQRPSADQDLTSARSSEVNPTVPFWGGPDGLAAGPRATGARASTPTATRSCASA